MSSYNNQFYDWVNITARRSAAELLPIVASHLKVRSVADVGCGEGTWLRQWMDLGIQDVLGIDGPHVDIRRLSIPPEFFNAFDLTNPFPVTRRFDLVQCLEVAEHLPANCGEPLISTLCNLSDVILFSAARPGQGGERHINERPPSYWADHFCSRGYSPYDVIRPLVARNRRIDKCYRYNTVLYANSAGAERLSADARSTSPHSLKSLDGISDPLWALRCALLRPLPESVVTWMSRARYRWIVLWSGR